MGDHGTGSSAARSSRLPEGLNQAIRVTSVVALLYLFLVGIKSLESGIGALGEGFVDRIVATVSNPMSALAAGILATVLMQSSSAVTSIIVGLVGAGVISVEAAVPMVMGANMGTTVTSTVAALGHLRQGAYFERAFAAATLHDAYNLLSLSFLLPLELAFGVVSRSARFLADLMGGWNSSGEPGFTAVIRDALAWPVGQIENFIDFLGWEAALGPLMIVLGLACVFFSLMFISRQMKLLMSGRIEGAVNSLLSKRGGALALTVGLVMTVIVQSSTITTSILVPLVAAGVLSLNNAFPVTVGANLGTTFTAVLASLASESPEALVIALCHVMYNVLSFLVVYLIPVVRQLPPMMARAMARLAMSNKTWVAIYVIGVWIVLPLLLLILS